jgi:hypothetical protein
MQPTTTQKEKQMAENIKLGDRVKHRIHGFTGVVTGITEYLQQCRQLLITPEKLDKEGNPMKGGWVRRAVGGSGQVRGLRAESGCGDEGESGQRGAPDRPHPPDSLIPNAWLARDAGAPVLG